MLAGRAMPKSEIPGTLLRAISGAWPFAEGEVWTPEKSSLLVFPAEAQRELSTQSEKLELAVSEMVLEDQADSSRSMCLPVSFARQCATHRQLVLRVLEMRMLSWP